MQAVLAIEVGRLASRSSQIEFESQSGAPHFCTVPAGSLQYPARVLELLVVPSCFSNTSTLSNLGSAKYSHT